MVKVIYEVNKETLFTAYFNHLAEMLKYEDEAQNDGDEIKRLEMQKVTIFDIWQESGLTENEKLEIIVTALYPTEKFHKVDEIRLRAKLVGILV